MRGFFLLSTNFFFSVRRRRRRWFCFFVFRICYCCCCCYRWRCAAIPYHLSTLIMHERVYRFSFSLWHICWMQLNRNYFYGQIQKQFLCLLVEHMKQSDTRKYTTPKRNEEKEKKSLSACVCVYVWLLFAYEQRCAFFAPSLWVRVIRLDSNRNCYSLINLLLLAGGDGGSIEHQPEAQLSTDCRGPHGSPFRIGLSRNEIRVEWSTSARSQPQTQICKYFNFNFSLFHSQFQKKQDINPHTAEWKVEW